jgi:hypothetical protein
MVTSQNGYVAGDRSVLHNPTVPGTSIDFPGGIRKGPAGDLLIWVALQLHRRVENGGTGYGMWGYNFREVRGSSWGDIEISISQVAVPTGEDTEYDYDELEFDLGENLPCSMGPSDPEETETSAGNVSNHGSGTALDWHAPRHPLGKANTFNPAQRAEIRKILAEAQGCVRWGGDYSGRKDDMHFEVVKDEAACARALAAVRGQSTPTTTPAPSGGLLQQGSKGPDVATLQRVLNRWYPRLPQLVADGDFGPATKARVMYFQRAARLTPVDGIVGPKTRKALGI